MARLEEWGETQQNEGQGKLSSGNNSERENFNLQYGVRINVVLLLKAKENRKIKKKAMLFTKIP